MGGGGETPPDFKYLVNYVRADAKDMSNCLSLEDDISKC